jgi:hypothetical protein
MMRAQVKPGFDWRRVTWGKADSPPRKLCCYCHGALPEVPLMLWREDGAGVSFCDDCVEQWWTAAGILK